MPITIRTIEPGDAEALTELLTVVDAETQFLLYEPGERTTSADEWRTRFAEIRADGLGEIFIAEDEGHMVGFLSALGESRQRLRHAIRLFIAIRQSHTGQRIGTQLFAAMEAWARGRGVHRVELHVASNNRQAIELYHKCGYHVEGFHRHAIRLGEAWIDDYTMAKLLE